MEFFRTNGFKASLLKLDDSFLDFKKPKNNKNFSQVPFGLKRQLYKKYEDKMNVIQAIENITEKVVENLKKPDVHIGYRALFDKAFN